MVAEVERGRGRGSHGPSLRSGAATPRRFGLRRADRKVVKKLLKSGQKVVKKWSKVVKSWSKAGQKLVKKLVKNLVKIWSKIWSKSGQKALAAARPTSSGRKLPRRHDSACGGPAPGPHGRGGVWSNTVRVGKWSK